MKKFIVTGFFICVSTLLFGQDDIPVDNTLGVDDIKKVDKVFPTIIVYNLPTSTVLQRGEMKLYLAHRMGVLGTGVDGAFGLYQANSRIGADLGLIKKLTIGIGSTSQKKLYDAYAKYQITQQSDKFPFETALFTSINYSNQKLDVPDEKQAAWQRVVYYNQFMLSRLFNGKYGVQIQIAHIHKNLVEIAADKNDIVAFGGIVNIKLNRMFYFATEYMYMPKKFVQSFSVQPHNLSLGIQIHTGPRHVFQICFSNSAGILPNNVITETTTKFGLKNLRLSFNIPTTFHLYN